MTKDQILDAAWELLRDDGGLSLDSVARRIGLTKAGVMHYFSTKQALMLGLVDHVADRWDASLRDCLDRECPGTEASAATPSQRMAAYLSWSLSGQFDGADLVALADPRLREPLRDRFVARMEPWLHLDADVPPEQHVRLSAVRLLADGAWFADASGILPLATSERQAVEQFARSLLDAS